MIGMMLGGTTQFLTNAPYSVPLYLNYNISSFKKKIVSLAFAS